MDNDPIVAIETAAYMGWVEEFPESEDRNGNNIGFILIDLLHPDEVKLFSSGKNFEHLMQRAADDGLKTLPITFPLQGVNAQWLKAIETVLANPGRRLLVRLSDQPGPGVVEAALALRGWNTPEGAETTVFIRHLELAPKNLATKIDLALNSAAYRKQKKSRTTIKPLDFLRDILEVRLQSESEVFVAAYDVGQGSANAIVDCFEHPKVLFDIGKPIFVFNHTVPSTPPRFFECDHRGTSTAPVILSHWDFDHWAGVLSSAYVYKDAAGNSCAKLTLIPNALERYWIAPNQEDLDLGPTHLELIRRLLKAENGASGYTALQYWPKNWFFTDYRDRPLLS